jgi:uncharacterized membrane protein
MSLTPIVAVHMTAAILAVATGPVAIWARKGAAQRSRLHRAFGYAWVTLMLITAISAIFIRSEIGLHVQWGSLAFSPIHLLIPLVLVMLFVAFRFLFKGNIRGHRLTMVNLYIGACLGAGVFTLAPNRYLGQLVWGQWLSLV